MWLFGIVIFTLRFFSVLTSIITTSEMDITTKKLQAALQQQNMYSILISIENRLRNLDNVYTTQYSPTLEGKLEHYARKLEVMDTKLNRLEATTALQLDKISENISSKNFKDDLVKSSLFRKIDAIYEGVSHRLAYVENKLEASNLNIQNKLDALAAKITKIEDTLTTRNAYIESELTDAIASIDDLKGTCENVEKNIISAYKEYTNKTLFINEKSIKENNRYLKRNVDEISKTISNKLQDIGKTIELQKNITNITSDLLKSLKINIENTTNKSSHIKEIWTENEIGESQIQKIFNLLNATKTENQNNFRTLIVQLGKIASRDSTENELVLSEQQSINEINKKLDSNFEKLILKQDLFLEGCYKLQMDESQIESKISIVLEKLIDIFEKKTSLQPKDLKSIEQLIKTHDSSSKRKLNGIANNIASLNQKISNTDSNGQSREILDEFDIKLNAVLNVVNGTNGNQNISIVERLGEIENKLLYIAEEYQIVKNTTQDSNDTKLVQNYVENINYLLESIKINTATNTTENNNTDVNSNKTNQSELTEDDILMKTFFKNSYFDENTTETNNNLPDEPNSEQEMNIIIPQMAYSSNEESSSKNSISDDEMEVLIFKDTSENRGYDDDYI